MAYVISEKRLYVMNISDPYNPTSVNSSIIPLYEGLSKIIIEGSIAYVVSEGHCQIVDITDPSAPKVISELGSFLNNLGGSLVVSDGIAYMTNHGYLGVTLQIIDVHDLSNPLPLLHFFTFDTKNDISPIEIAVSDQIVYLTHETGLHIVDVSNPSVPEEADGLETPGPVRDIEIVDSTAYIVTDNDFQVMDITTPSSPKFVTSVPMTGEVSNCLTLDQNMAYVAYKTETAGGVQVIDLKNSSHPRTIASFHTMSEANQVVLTDDLAYVACNLSPIAGGVLVMPVPLELQPVDMKSGTSMELRIPSPRLPGNYTLRLFNTEEETELTGAMTFISPEDAALLDKKAIIVAGGGMPSESYPNSLWEDTRLCSDAAYSALLWQGYSRENICYLTPSNIDVDGDGILNDADGDATYQNLHEAITTWAKSPPRPDKPASELLLYITDHGGEGTFRLNASETLHAEDLDKWLDDLQATMPGKVILVYDACYSGSFLPMMTPPEGKERIVLSSTAPEEEALFGKLGDVRGISFSFQFWSAIHNGSGLSDAFAFGGRMLNGLGRHQTPLLDADGDGIGNEHEEDHGAVTDISIGRGSISIGAAMPLILDVCGSQSLHGSSTATLWAGPVNSDNSIIRVWAVITPPDFDPAPGLPILDLPSLELRDADHDGIYEGSYDQFAARGTYKISIYATDTQDAFSLPALTEVIQVCPKGDLTGDGEIGLADAILALKAVAGDDVRPVCSPSGSDVNGDGRFGTEEAVYVLRHVAEPV